MSKSTDFEKHITQQLARIAHMPGFPESDTAIRDYKAALAVAGTIEGVTRVMDDITSQVWDWLPSAAVLRVKAYEQADKPTVGCEACDWTGWKHKKGDGLYSGVMECACRKVTV